MAIITACPGTPEDRGERPRLGLQPPWGPYSIPSNFESRVLDYVSSLIIKYQKSGTLWTNLCNIVPNRHPYTNDLYKQQMPGIQQVQYLLSGYSNSGEVYTLQNTCNYIMKGPKDFSISEWYADAANNYFNEPPIKSRIVGPSTDPYFTKTAPDNTSVSNVMFTYVLRFWDARFRNIVDATFNKLASAAVEAANAKCASSTGNPPPPTNPVNPVIDPRPPITQTPILDNRGVGIRPRRPVQPIRRSTTVTRNQANPVQPIRRR